MSVTVKLAEPVRTCRARLLRVADDELLVEDPRVEVDLGVNGPAHELRQDLAVDVEIRRCGRGLEGPLLAEVVALGHEPHAETPGWSHAGLEPPASPLDGVGDPGVVDLLDGQIERELGRVEKLDDDRLEVVGRAVLLGA